MKISLCIPAWRGAALSRLLDSVGTQRHPLEYELLVRDDCSPHGVQEAFNRARRAEDPWRYFRNEDNLGGYSNIRMCTREAVGRYVLIISDDDQLKPDAFEMLDRLIELADQSEARVIYACDRLNDRFLGGLCEIQSFRWLRDVSINAPAFISAVAWRREYWDSYQYDSYPPSLSLPQLDAFVEACGAGPIVLIAKNLVLVGREDDTDSPDYWFYRRHAPVDCYEYPLLYRKVLRSEQLDLVTRVCVYARRLSLLRQIYKKVLFMRWNESYYHPSVLHMMRFHGFTIYGVLFWPIVAVLLKTSLGLWLAKRRYGEREKLPARTRETDAYE